MNTGICHSPCIDRNFSNTLYIIKGIIGNSAVKPSRMSFHCTDNEIFRKPIGKSFRRSLIQQKKQRSETADDSGKVMSELV